MKGRKVIEALLRGKLSREQENMEDILTSNVFGLMKYLPPGEALFPFLAEARDLAGGQPLAFLRDAEGGDVEYEFWPPWSASDDAHGCEPDLMLHIRVLGRTAAVLVEAKYHSGKSSAASDEEGEPPSDQLAKEWNQLVRRPDCGAQLVLVYLTAGVTVPAAEIEDSIREYCEKRRVPGASEPVMAWLSWRHLVEKVKGARGPVVRDLAALLERLDLHFYHGITEVEPLLAAVWSFTAPRPVFGWGDGLHAGPLEWGFRP